MCPRHLLDTNVTITHARAHLSEQIFALNSHQNTIMTDWRDGFYVERTRLLTFTGAGIRRDRHLLFEVEMYLQKGCIMVSGVGSS